MNNPRSTTAGAFAVRPDRMRGWAAVLLAGMLLTGTPAVALPAEEQDDCDRRWTVGGKGAAPPWVRVNGYRIGIQKAEAGQFRRTGLRGSMARDEWVFLMSASRLILIFEEGKLASATMILESSDYGEAYPEVIEQMGPADDFGESYLLWRSEKCDTVKILKDDGDNVVILVQSLDYFQRKTLRKK